MTRLRQLVEALLDEQGFLPHSRTQEAQAGASLAPTPTAPGLRTEIPDAVSGARAGRDQTMKGPLHSVFLNEGPPVGDPAADWFDGMAAPWTTGKEGQ